LTLSPGARLGSYEIGAKLGEGGMGEVYRATDSRLRREVAIKVLPAGLTTDEERLARFEREAQLLAQLHHPNIASVFGLEESGGVRALVMELVEGEDLAERLKRGAIPVDEAVAIAKQIAEALEEAHEKGIVHRDLKPANVKLTPDGKVKVLDFGLAKAWSGDGPGATSLDDLLRRPDAAGVATASLPAVTPAPGPPRPRSPVLVLVGLAAAAVCGAVSAWLFLPPRPAAPVTTPAAHDGLVRATIELPDAAPLALGSRTTLAGFDSAVLALSPDGRTLAYVGQAPAGTMLYLRELSGATVAPVAGTEGAISPFFSPDGRWLGFLTDARVKKVALGGGAAVTVCEASTPVRARWTSDDTIYFSTDYGLGLWRVAASGGRASKVEKADDVYSRWSDVSLDGRWVLRTDHMRSISGDYASVSVVPLAGGPARVVVSSGYDARFLGEDGLSFARAGTLHAIAFDAEKGATAGEPRPVAEGVSMDSLFQQVHAAASGHRTYGHEPTLSCGIVPICRPNRSRSRSTSSSCGGSTRTPRPGRTGGPPSCAPPSRATSRPSADATSTRPSGRPTRTPATRWPRRWRA
jgi:hypothetical protein